MLTIIQATIALFMILGASAQMLPDSGALIMNELEHLYFDSGGPAGFVSGITPCDIYIDSSTGTQNNTLGRQTSAQWIRTAFRKVTPFNSLVIFVKISNWKFIVYFSIGIQNSHMKL